MILSEKSDDLEEDCGDDGGDDDDGYDEDGSETDKGSIDCDEVLLLLQQEYELLEEAEIEGFHFQLDLSNISLLFLEATQETNFDRDILPQYVFLVIETKFEKDRDIEHKTERVCDGVGEVSIFYFFI